MNTSRLEAPPPKVKVDLVRVYDDFLEEAEQKILLAHLLAPGWAYGAYSDPTPGSSRYWYKHFAGYVRDGKEGRTEVGVERELSAASEIIFRVWLKLKAGPLAGHMLTRCYANGYPSGAEGGVHIDSNVPDHFTAIYYPHLAWRPSYGGETVFFNADGSDLIFCAYPKPNRLVVFPGVVPHAARAVSRACAELRVTLMFKTAISSFPAA
jgi:SM-20-related protein